MSAFKKVLESDGRPYLHPKSSQAEIKEYMEKGKPKSHEQHESKTSEKKEHMAKKMKPSFEDTDKKIGEQILKGKIAAAKHRLT